MIVAVALAYVAHVLATGVAEILPTLGEPRYPLLATSVLLLALCTIAGGVLWHEALQAFGQVLPLRQSMRLHLLSIPAKYVPGLGLQHVGKVSLAAGVGVPPIAGAAAAALEFLVVCSSGIVAGLLALPLALEALPPSVELRSLGSLGWWPSLLFAVVTCLSLSLIVPLPLRRLAGPRYRLSIGRGLALVLGVAGIWLLLSLSVYLLASSLYKTSATQLPVYGVAVIGSLLAGLLSVTPMGIGVREATLTVLLSAVVSPPQAAMLAILWRLASIAVEGLCFAAAVKL